MLSFRPILVKSIHLIKWGFGTYENMITYVDKNSSNTLFYTEITVSITVSRT